MTEDCYHPLRRQVLDEVHARPFQLTRAPRRFLHAAFTIDQAGGEAAVQALDHWCATTGGERPAPGANFHRIAFPSARLRWERHTEFTTYTWDTACTADEPFGWPLAEASPVGEALPAPGPLLAAVDLVIIGADGAPDDLSGLFDQTSLCVASVHDGAARIITDFRQDARGSTRILVIDRGLHPQVAGALVQRLLEIETYRTFALLGLPEAMRSAPVVGRIETELVRVTGQMRAPSDLADNSVLLDGLMALASELEAEAAICAYRFGATRAYDAIVRSRLDVVGEQPVEGYLTWKAFLDRRMAPAMRTCQTVADRQAELARKLSRAANLLRTRVDIEVEQQNRSVLQAMNERARLQLRLQQTVEGLSVAAVSYYVVALIGVLFEGARDAGLTTAEPGILSALAVPVVIGTIWLIVRRIRRKHSE
ncbi:MAG: DUF3422 domain-containing protein [Hyphomicrobiales bacterium]|nr:DUF3422 domain-containing protein [Hyphomicrobiales bacterium]OQW84813.1 MAG: Egg lysin [Proteobacteria bacterium ST_bin15]